MYSSRRMERIIMQVSLQIIVIFSLQTDESGPPVLLKVKRLTMNLNVTFFLTSGVLYLSL